MKQCNLCKVTKPLSSFTIDRHNKDGYKQRCRGCWKLYMKRYIKNTPGFYYKVLVKRRKKFKEKYGIGPGTLFRYGARLSIEVYKKYDSRCAHCKTNQNLTFHHIDGRGRNLVNMGLKPNNTLDNLLLICRSCHGKIDGRKGKGVKHSSHRRR